ncbi:MAG TPA: polyisoprenoid-binding protein [Nitrospiraceae bacterium]|jgi:polyisoprenoid-binding protein YceI|nr:polyisoprenoid-binding protein [Nitrospiraceae bacterium]
MATWIIDPDHSVAAFRVRHMMVANVHGQFNKLSGSIQFEPPDMAHLSVEAQIDATGIYTGIQKRDDHLRSPDFFDVANYPNIVFKSSKAEAVSGNRGKLTGNLTMRGITRPVALDIEFFGPVKDPFDEGGISIGFNASATVNRKDYGIMWNAETESVVVAGWEVLISLEIEADRTVG